MLCGWDEMTFNAMVRCIQLLQCVLSLCMSLSLSLCVCLCEFIKTLEKFCKCRNFAKDFFGTEKTRILPSLERFQRDFIFYKTLKIFAQTHADLVWRIITCIVIYIQIVSVRFFTFSTWIFCCCGDS